MPELELKDITQGTDLSNKLVVKSSLLNDDSFTDNLTFDQAFEGVPTQNLLPGIQSAVNQNTGIQFQTDKVNAVGYYQSVNYSATNATGWRIDTDGNAFFNGTSELRAFRLIQRYTAGETVNVGRLVVLKHKQCVWGNDGSADRNTTAVLSEFTYVDQDNPATATGAAPTLVKLGTTTGAGNYFAIGKIDFTSNPPGLPSWYEVESVKFRMYVVFAAGAAHTVSFVMNSAAYTESTVTWNTKPATLGYSAASATGTAVISESMASTANLLNTGYIEFDITEMYRLWTSGAVTNNGFTIVTSIATGNAQIGGIARNGGGILDQEVYLSILPTVNNPGSGNTITVNDGKVYQADFSDYNRIKQIIGIAGATTAAGNTVDVYSLADRSVIPTSVLSIASAAVGRPFYLTDASGLISTLTNDDIITSGKWNLRIGVGTSNGLVVDFDRNPVFIKSMTMSSFPSTGLLPPPLARMAYITFGISWTDITTHNFRGQMTLLRDRITTSTVDEQKDGADGAVGAHNIIITATWNTGAGGALVFTKTTNPALTSESLSFTVYWYK